MNLLDNLKLNPKDIAVGQQSLIHQWLDELKPDIDFELVPSPPDTITWIATLKNKSCPRGYKIQVTQNNTHRAFVSKIPLPTGAVRTKSLYEHILKLNYRIPAAYIGLDKKGGLYIKQSVLLEDSDKARFTRDLVDFNKIHEYVFSDVINQASKEKELGYGP